VLFPAVLSDTGEVVTVPGLKTSPTNVNDGNGAGSDWLAAIDTLVVQPDMAAATRSTVEMALSVKDGQP